MSTDVVPGAVLPATAAERYPHAYAVVDVETTGLEPEVSRVLQVAVTLLAADGTVEHEWSTLVDPRCDPGPVDIHGITAERLRGAPVFADVAPRLAELLAGRVFVAHNARFDWSFLAAEFRRTPHVPDVEHRLCTRALAKRLGLPVPDLKLATLAAHWGVEQRRPHDAADDTRVLVELLRHSLRAADSLGVELPLTPCSEPAAPRGNPWRPTPPAAPPGPLTAGLPAARAAQPLTGRRVLVLGGPHERAADVREDVVARGGAAAVRLTLGVTDVVALDGAELDRRWPRVRARALPLLDPRTWRRPGAPEPGGGELPPLPLCLPRGGVLDLPPGVRRWSLDVTWAHGADAVDVVVFRTDAAERTHATDDLAFHGAPATADGSVSLQLTTPGEAVADVELDALPPGTDKLLVAAALPTRTFGDVGPVEVVLRTPAGTAVAVAVLDAGPADRSLVLASLHRHGARWRFRVVGRGDAAGLAELARGFGVG
ncbi:hypothetical protein NUM3379_15510 [Kineococcus sp. NUM-3379]